jgi:hypothetical protein
MGLLHLSSPTPPSRQNGLVRGRSARLDPSLPRARPDPSQLDVTRISLRPVPSLVVSDASHDPSHLIRFESACSDPSLPRSVSMTPYVPGSQPLWPSSRSETTFVTGQAKSGPKKGLGFEGPLYISRTWNGVKQMNGQCSGCHGLGRPRWLQGLGATFEITSQS